jgi:hypothetical protein
MPAAAGAADPLPPGAVKSANLEYVDREAGAAGITEGKFDRVGGDDILIVTGRFGFKSYDVSDPANPVLLDEFMPEGIATRLVNGAQGYWQDEDMELDTKRNLIIGALDPRHNDQDAAATGCPDSDQLAVRDVDCKSGFFVISYNDPANLRQVGDFVSLPSGHTASCIQDCKYIWTGGPARRDDQDWLGPRNGQLTLPPFNDQAPQTYDNRAIGDGRPIWVTDLRNPAKPVVSDEPIDLWRNDGYTDYSHDVDEDDRGIAWVSGRGGIRGYATSGRHRDPFQNRVREASPFDPILVAGGGIEWDETSDNSGKGTAQPTMLMHNSGRPTDGKVRADGVKNGSVLVGTEEDFTTLDGCADSGRIVLADLTDSWGGEPTSKSTRANRYRMKALDSFHPFIDTRETAAPGPGGCSAHYFEIEGPMLGAAWYGQGLRMLDISDARDVSQVGYYRVDANSAAGITGSNSWDVAFRSVTTKNKGRKTTDDYVYLFDMSRGVEVLKIKSGLAKTSRMKSVTAPSMGARAARDSAKPVSSLVNTGDPNRFVCPLFE